MEYARVRTAVYYLSIDFTIVSSIQKYTVVYSGILTSLSSAVIAHTATSDNDEEC